MTRTEAEGRVLAGRYRLIQQIDRGGAAVVWRARDLRLERDVAVKILGAEADDAFRERFRQEAQRAASVTHPNVVAVYDEGQDGSDAFMVMEYVRGTTLRDLVVRDGPRSPEAASRIVSQIAAALDAAHAAGVLHLDVKPANVILGEDGLAKLADFGVAVAARGDAERELIGTARYVAPERVEGRAPTPPSDVYGLALVAYELVAGRPAYQSVENEDLLRMRLEGPTPSLRAARPDVGGALDAVVARALAREPRDRYQTAGAFARAFEDASGGSDETMPIGAVASRPLPRARRWSGPALDGTLATVAVIVVLLVVVAFFMNAGAATVVPSPAATPTRSAPGAGLTAPNVVGKKLSDAIGQLRAAGFGTVAWDVAPGQSGKACDVARQEPPAGSPFARGQSATLFYIAGKDCTKGGG